VGNICPPTNIRASSAEEKDSISVEKDSDVSPVDFEELGVVPLEEQTISTPIGLGDGIHAEETGITGCTRTGVGNICPPTNIRASLVEKESVDFGEVGVVIGLGLGDDEKNDALNSSSSIR
jgi:hypothetical protein